MAYKKSLLAGGGFYPNGEFPIVDAKDVYVDDNTRLNEALASLSSYKIEVVDSLPADPDNNTIYFILGE